MGKGFAAGPGSLSTLFKPVSRGEGFQYTGGIMRKKFFSFLVNAPVAVKDFGERRKWRWMAEFGKSLHNLAAAKVQAGWVA
jgi:hypothetical protein